MLFRLTIHKISMSFDTKCSCLFALDSAVDLTSFPETSPLEIMTAFVLKIFVLFCFRRYWNIKAKNKTRGRKGKSTKRRDLLRSQDLFHDLLTLAGYVEVLVIPPGARRIKVVEEKPAHSYLGNLCYRPEPIQAEPSSLPWGCDETRMSVCF